MGMTRITALFAAALLLVGCGQGTTPFSTLDRDAQAQSTHGLEQGFKDVHQAIFKYLDRNSDARIDEYEAGPHIPLDDFAKMDARGRGDGKITYQQFMEYGTAGGFFGGRDNQTKFMRRMRGFLDSAFRTFDANRNGYLEATELNVKAWTAAGLGFQYPNLRVTVRLALPDEAAFTAGDKTGDGRISAGEWEDLYVGLVVKAIATL